MKKSLLTVLSVLLIIFCGACNSPAKDDTADPTHTHKEDTAPTDHIHTEAPAMKPSIVNIKGEVEGNVYKNDYLKLVFTKPDNWTFLPEDAVKSRDEAYDMIAVDYITNAGVYLAFENLELTAGNRMTTEEYVESVLKAGVDLTPDSTITEQKEVVIGPNTYTKVTISTADHNTPITKHIYLRSVDKYMVQLIASIPTANADKVDFDAMLG